MRDCARFIPRYFSQLNGLAWICRDSVNFDLSIYENDSGDDTVKLLKQQSVVINDCWEFFPVNRFFIDCQTLNTKKYGSVNNHKRVELLASYRYQTLKQAVLDRNKIYDYILFIEPDVQFDIDYISHFLYLYCGKGYDIFSPVSVREDNPQELYDGWATRLKEGDVEWLGSNPNKIRDIKEKFGNPISVYSTFNCFCVYRAAPVINMVRDNINPFSKLRKDTKYDCDTANICHNLWDMGHKKFIMNLDYKVVHHP